MELTRVVESWLPESDTVWLCCLVCRQGHERVYSLITLRQKSSKVNDRLLRSREREETERQRETARGTRLCLSRFVKQRQK